MLSAGTAGAPRAAALRGLQARAIPAGVTVPRATELVEMIIVNKNYYIRQHCIYRIINSDPNLAFPGSSPDTSRLLREDRLGETPQQACLRGGSPAA